MQLLMLSAYRSVYPFEESQLDHQVMSALAQHFDSVHMVVRSRDRTRRSWSGGRVGVTYLPLASPPVSTLLFLMSCFLLSVSLIRRNKVDVVSGSDLAGSLVGVALKMIFRKPLVVQLQNEFFEPHPSMGSGLKRAFLRWLAGRVCRRADAIRCVSRSLMDNARAHGVPAEKLFTIGTRADTKMFDPSRFSSQRQELRKEIAVDDRKVLVFTGSLARRKGVDVLLAALSQVVSTLPDAYLLIAGEGPERPRLTALCDQFGLTENVRFLGHTDYTKIPALLATADIYVFPSFSEGMPRAVLEAMAMELPVVSSKVDGIGEVIENDNTGLLVQPGDETELAQALLRVLGDSDFGRDLGVRARAFVLENYEFEAQIVKLADIHLNTVNHRN
jgi:glycosyltransferase involved in cell wall biosynthesis